MGDIATEGMNSPTLNKLENHDHGESSSVGSTPEAEGIEQDNAQLQEPGQLPQKRKGGRKPVSADLHIFVSIPSAVEEGSTEKRLY